MVCVEAVSKKGKGSRSHNELTVLDVEEGNEHGEQPGHGNLTHQLPVAMVGTECQCAFAQVSQTLRRRKQQRVNIHLVTSYTHFPPISSSASGRVFFIFYFFIATHLSQSDHEEVVRIFGVILCQLPQHGGQTGVICA